MKKILVTGGSGFIGTNFVNFLSKTDSRILNIDKISEISTPENFKKIINKKNYFFLKNNLENPNQIYKILKKFKPDLIVNFASESHVDRSINEPLYFIKNNISCSSNLFYAYSLYYKKNKIKLFNISTDEVFGSIPKGSSKEMDKYNPSSPYSASKGSIDLIATSFNKTYGTEIKIINMVNNYGPFQFPEKLIPTIIFHYLNNKKAPIYGNGTNIREWLHVTDHCRAIQLVIEKGISGETYNIGSGFYLSNIDLAKNIIKILGVKEDMIQFVTDRKGHDFRYAVNYDKIRNLGYKPENNFSRLLKETVDWYKNNQNWWSAP